MSGSLIMKFHHNMRTASQWVQPHRLYHHVHMMPGHAFPVTVRIFMLPLLGRTVLAVILWLLILSGDIETNPGPVGQLTQENLWEVMGALYETRAKWYQIGVQLKLSVGVLNAIRSEFSDEMVCLTEMCSHWLRRINPHPSWVALAQALESPPVGEGHLAQQLRYKYCRGGEDMIPHVYPTPSPPGAPPTLQVPLDKPSIRQYVKQLESRFSDLVYCTYLLLTDKGIEAHHFHACLMALDLSRRKEHEEFLSIIFKPGTTFNDLWCKLCKYWNFLNFNMLEHIVNKLGSPELKHQMKSYVCDLQKFRSATRLCDFVDCWPVMGQAPPTSDLRTLVVMRHLDWDRCTLEDLETVQGGITHKFFLPDFILQLSKIEEGIITPHTSQGQLEPTSKSKHLYNEAMKEGHVKSRNTVTVFVGAAGTGKTCSKHVLMNENPPEVRVSTPMAERPVKVMKILTIDGFKWHRLSPADQKEILAKFMVNIPAGTGEASGKEAIPIKIADKTNSMKSSSEAPHGKSLSSGQAKEIPPSMPKGDPTSKVDSTSIAESARIERVEALLESSTFQTEISRLIELLSGTETPLEASLVYLTDSGGQPQFHEVLPIFLRRTSVYIFVMKLSETLDERPLIKYFDDNGNVICKPYAAAHTNLQILRHCIRTMQSHKFRKAAGKAPNLVFIGTHKDQEHLCPETREIKNQKLADMLLPEFQNEVVYSNLANRELIFPLNAKSPGEEEQKVAEEIRKLIMSMCTADPDEIPLRWYCLELKLQEIAQALGRGVMSKDECFAVARTLHFNTESFEAALQYLDELNIIFYYPDILPNTVFTDSQVLIAKASELVKFSHELRNKDAESLVVARRGECRYFKDYALVTVGFLKSFNEHYVDKIFTPNDLVKLFRALLVFADFSDTEYFMPCLLQIISSEEVAKHRVSSSAATVPLLLHFPPGVPPLGIFCSLVVYLLSASNHSPSPWKLKLDHSKKSPVCLHRNCVQFTIPKYPGTITLIDSFDFFEVHISTQLCSLVREALLTGLERVISNLGYSCQPQLAFLCPCSRESLHPASIGAAEPCWICTQDPDTFGDIDEKQQMWLPTSASLSSGSTTSQVVSATTATPPSVHVPRDVATRPLPSPPPPSSTAATGSGIARPRIGLDLESVDGTTVLDEDDLHDVRSAVADLAGRWQDLGVSLGIRQGDLDAILSDNSHSSSGCLRKMLSLWLRQSYKVERFGKPTWRRLVEAVEDHVGGNNFALAQTIAREHPALSSPPTKVPRNC